MILHIAGNKSKSELTCIDEKSIQPNAVDIRLDKVFKVLSNRFILFENDKINRMTQQQFTIGDGWFNLSEGVYEVVMQNQVNIGDNETGLVIPRSTLVRNGIILQSGLYDSGYKGMIIACLHVTLNSFQVKQGTRIGQFVIFQSEMLKKYDGQYGIDKDGIFKESDKKYL